MAPAPTGRGKPRENAFPFDVGIKGRKTGITLPDTGIRDENGLEPMDHLFSSPQKATATVSKSSAKRNGGNATLSSDDMDEGESTAPEPTTMLTQRASMSMRLPPPKSKSPMKTYLNSPARRNPSLGPVSSPVRGSIVEHRAASVSTNVRRKLDFSSGSLDATEDSPPTSMSQQKRRRESANPKPDNAKLTNNTQLAPLKRTFQFIGGYNEAGPSGLNHSSTGAEDSYQMINGGDDEEVPEDVTVEAPIEALESYPLQPTRKRGRPKKGVATPVVEEVVVESTVKKGKAGRSKMAEVPIEEAEEPAEPPAKRARRSLDVPEITRISKPKKTIKVDALEASRAAIKQSKGATKADISEVEAAMNKSKKTTVASFTARSKNKIKQTQLTTIAESDSPQVHRGPPMPRRKGLMTVRRETPMEGTGFKQTRSGRNSIKPLAYWKNERAEYSDDEVEDLVGKFLVPTIKGVVRVDEAADTIKRSKRTKSSKPKKRQEESEEEEDVEPWEVEPGRLYGGVVVWDPEDPSGVHSEEREEELALSSAAIITRDIAGASFRFAKTLTLPFFGSGIVDLPPGSIKKPKPSRKMQMAFFVFTGHVKVMINETEFRISKGGMFQVPRGNTYSIENHHDTLARIFFSQGCEIESEDAVQSPRLEYPS